MDAASGRTRTHGCVVDMFSRSIFRFWDWIRSLAGLHIVRTVPIACTVRKDELTPFVVCRQL